MEFILLELKLINEKIDNIHSNQISLHEKIDKLIYDDINELKVNIASSANIITTHISFIENVFDTVKNPLYYILNKVTKIQNSTINYIC